MRHHNPSPLIPKPEFEHYCLTQIKSDYVLKPTGFEPQTNVRLPCGSKMLDNVACMFTELCRSDLFDIVADKGAVADPDLLRSLFSQLMQAVEATHKEGLAHLDIKLENVLVANDFSLRLCDFGFARKADSRLSGSIGTQGWMPPEVLTGNHFYCG